MYPIDLRAGPSLGRECSYRAPDLCLFRAAAMVDCCLSVVREMAEAISASYVGGGEKVSSSLSTAGHA